MVLTASFLGGIRWTFTQLLMQKAELGQCRVTVNMKTIALRRPRPTAFCGYVIITHN